MADKFREHVCPNCGAPLGIPEKHERFFKCQFCGTVLEDQATREEQQTGVFKIKVSQEDISNARASRVPVYSSPPKPISMPTAAASNRLGCMIGAAIFLLIGGILSVGLVPALFAGGSFSILPDFVEERIDPSGLNGLQLYSFGPSVILPSDNDTSADFFGIANGPDSTYYATYIDFDLTPGLRWLVQLPDKEVFWIYNQTVADQTRVYFSYEKTIVAFNRMTGAQIWESNLTDKIQHNICPDCFQLFNDRIATLTDDGTLQVWDAATGSLRWQASLNGTPRQIVNFGGNPAALDEIEDTVGFKVFNLQTGSIEQQFFPACPNEPFPNSPQEIGIYDYVLPIQQDRSAVFIGGFFDPGCAIRWLPGAESPAWTTTFDSKFVGNLDPENFLVTADNVFVGNGNGAFMLDLASGGFTLLGEDENNDHAFFPIAFSDGVAMLRVDITRGTRHWEIWGVDVSLGNVKWTYEPESPNFVGSPAEASAISTRGGWTAGLTAGGLTVAQIFSEDGRIQFQTIAPQSGTASTPVTIENDLRGAFTFRLVPLGWRSNTFWMVKDFDQPTVQGVDGGSGETNAIWP